MSSWQIYKLEIFTQKLNNERSINKKISGNDRGGYPKS